MASDFIMIATRREKPGTDRRLHMPTSKQPERLTPRLDAFLMGFVAFTRVFSVAHPLPMGHRRDVGLITDQANIQRDFARGCAALLNDYDLKQTARRPASNLAPTSSKK